MATPIRQRIARLQKAIRQGTGPLELLSMTDAQLEAIVEGSLSDEEAEVLASLSDEELWAIVATAGAGRSLAPAGEPLELPVGDEQ